MELSGLLGGCISLRRSSMLKLLAAGATAFFVTLSSTAFAQAPSTMGPGRLGQADLAKLTDERIAIVKSVLQLTLIKRNTGQLSQTLSGSGRKTVMPAWRA